MCLLVVASQTVPGEPLIVGANRDEVLDRPSTSITVLDDGPPRVLGGRDDLSGGTWLAVNADGVCAGLTNQPLGDLKDPTKRSRGELPLAAARHRTAAGAVSALVREVDPADYNGAWMLVGDPVSLHFVDFTGSEVMAVELEPGIHVLENRAVDAPSAKVDLVRSGLGRVGGGAPPLDGDDVVSAFARVLADHRIPEGDERPNSANCVHLDGFGTRSSCIVRVGVAPSGGTLPRPGVWVADGPPCTVPYEDATPLWGAGSRVWPRAL
ncbi:MAG TPA: NRDE family protein [Acidimicrobiales bacterium]|nr:NRDE family protein [Acidimicrobiales bacterium]